MNDDETGALILELAEANVPLVRAKLRRWRVWPTSTGLDEIVEAVQADLVATLWRTRDRWLAFPDTDQRRWACGVAKQITMSRGKRYSAHVWSEQPTGWTDDQPDSDVDVDGNAGHGQGATHAHRWSRELLELQVQVERELGVLAWEQITTRALHGQSTVIRSELAVALSDVRAGRPIDLAPLVRRCAVTWQGWASTRIAFREPLAVERAVRLGLFRDDVTALAALATWWAEQRLVAHQAITADAIMGSGLVDHYGSDTARRQAAPVLASQLQEYVHVHRGGAVG